MTSAVFALVDTSGSMSSEGKIAAIQTQLPELVDMLRESQQVNRQGISFALLSFDETTKEQLYPPVPVGQDASDKKVREAVGERLKVTPGKDGFYPTTNYSQLFQCLPHYLAENKAFDRIYLLLFTDGMPTDQRQTLKEALSALQNVGWFADKRCQRYIKLEGDSASGVPSAAVSFVRSRGDIFPGNPAGFERMVDKLRSSLSQAI